VYAAELRDHPDADSTQLLQHMEMLENRLGVSPHPQRRGEVKRGSGAQLLPSEMHSGNLGTKRRGNIPNLSGITCSCQGVPSNVEGDSRRWSSCNMLSTNSQKRRRVLQPPPRRPAVRRSEKSPKRGLLAA